MSLSQRCLSALCPRRSGVDCSGRPVQLGDTDSGGYPVGWVDRSGQAWASHRERCLAVASGRFDEVLAGSRSMRLPRLRLTLRHAPLYPRAALREYRETAELRVLFGRLRSG